MTSIQRQLKITLETVTPLFLAGADPKGDPELRPPAFRAAMRYWWRAALGGVIGDNLSRLTELESRVFGSTKFASPIGLRLKQLAKLNGETALILPHKGGASRRCIPEGTRFELTLSAHFTCDADIWQAACAALQIALSFGGVGLRSRRGHGTLRIVATSDAQLIQRSPIQVDDWKRYLKDSAERLIKSAQTLAGATVSAPSALGKYPRASKDSKIRLCSSPVKSSSVDTIVHVMSKMPNVPWVGSIKPQRQASPLWVHPIHIEKGYGLLLVTLPSNFKGSNNHELNKLLDENFYGDDLSIQGWNK